MNTTIDRDSCLHKLINSSYDSLTGRLLTYTTSRIVDPKTTFFVKKVALPVLSLIATPFTTMIDLGYHTYSLIRHGSTDHALFLIGTIATLVTMPFRWIAHYFGNPTLLFSVNFVSNNRTQMTPLMEEFHLFQTNYGHPDTSKIDFLIHLMIEKNIPPTTEEWRAALFLATNNRNFRDFQSNVIQIIKKLFHLVNDPNARVNGLSSNGSYISDIRKSPIEYAVEINHADLLEIFLFTENFTPSNSEALSLFKKLISRGLDSWMDILKKLLPYIEPAEITQEILQMLINSWSREYNNHATFAQLLIEKGSIIIDLDLIKSALKCRHSGFIKCLLDAFPKTHGITAPQYEDLLITAFKHLSPENPDFQCIEMLLTHSKNNTKIDNESLINKAFDSMNSCGHNSRYQPFLKFVELLLKGKSYYIGPQTPLVYAIYTKNQNLLTAIQELSKHNYYDAKNFITPTLSVENSSSNNTVSPLQLAFEMGNFPAFRLILNKIDIPSVIQIMTPVIDSYLTFNNLDYSLNQYLEKLIQKIGSSDNTHTLLTNLKNLQNKLHQLPLLSAPCGYLSSWPGAVFSDDLRRQMISRAKSEQNRDYKKLLERIELACQQGTPASIFNLDSSILSRYLDDELRGLSSIADPDKRLGTLEADPLKKDVWKGLLAIQTQYQWSNLVRAIEKDFAATQLNFPDLPETSRFFYVRICRYGDLFTFQDRSQIFYSDNPNATIQELTQKFTTDREIIALETTNAKNDTIRQFLIKLQDTGNQLFLLLKKQLRPSSPSSPQNSTSSQEAPTSKSISLSTYFPDHLKNGMNLAKQRIENNQPMTEIAMKYLEILKTILNALETNNVTLILGESNTPEQVAKRVEDIIATMNDALNDTQDDTLVTNLTDALHKLQEDLSSQFKTA